MYGAPPSTLFGTDLLFPSVIYYNGYNVFVFRFHNFFSPTFFPPQPIQEGRHHLVGDDDNEKNKNKTLCCNKFIMAYRSQGDGTESASVIIGGSTFVKACQAEIAIGINLWKGCQQIMKQKGRAATELGHNLRQGQIVTDYVSFLERRRLNAL